MLGLVPAFACTPSPRPSPITPPPEARAAIFAQRDASGVRAEGLSLEWLERPFDVDLGAESWILWLRDPWEGLGRRPGPLLADPQGEGLPDLAGAAQLDADGQHPVPGFEVLPEWIQALSLPPIVGACPDSWSEDRPFRAPARCPLPAAEPPWCYAAPVPFQGFIDNDLSGVGSFGIDADGSTWLYLFTERWQTPRGNNDTELARARLVAFDRLDPGSFERLPGAPELSASFRGWGWRPQLRARGDEILFHASYPDGAWWDEELWSLARRWDGTWSAAPLLGLVALDNGRDETDADQAYTPILLPDDRTLLYSRLTPSGRPDTRFGRRRSTRAGDRDFEPLPRLAFDAKASEAHTLDCHRRGVVYVREVTTGSTTRGLVRAPILGFDPLEFGVAEPLRDAQTDTPLTVPWGEVYLAISPSCDLYLTFRAFDQVHTTVYRSAPCRD